MLKNLRGRIYYRLHLCAAWADINGKRTAGEMYRLVARYTL